MRRQRRKLPLLPSPSRSVRYVEVGIFRRWSSSSSRRFAVIRWSVHGSRSRSIPLHNPTSIWTLTRYFEEPEKTSAIGNWNMKLDSNSPSLSLFFNLIDPQYPLTMRHDGLGYYYQRRIEINLYPGQPWRFEKVQMSRETLLWSMNMGQFTNLVWSCQIFNLKCLEFISFQCSKVLPLGLLR